ncbi:MAG: peptide/nickel transport system permease protein [Maritalea sp.]|jgi:peptide/nickel transport system permease protein
MNGQTHMPNIAPTPEEVARELGLKPQQNWLRKLPPMLGGLITNKKGLAGVILLLVLILSAVFAPALSEYNPNRRAGGPHVSPNAEHVLGTTRVGKDVWTQLLYGGRTSLAVGFIAGIVATVIGLFVGIASGYFGGKVDEILSFFVNVVLVLPALPLIIVIAAFIEEASPPVIGLVLALTGWGWSARTIRTVTLSLRTKEFILAAELLGEKKWRIIIMELFPNMLSFVVGGFVLATIYAILAEAGLEFIGLGDPSSVTWGTMLFWAQKNSALQTGAWWEVWPECIAIMVTGAALVLVNFAVDEITSPQLRAGRHIPAIRKFLAKRGRSTDVF